MADHHLAHLSHPPPRDPGQALFLDFDGTLVDLVDRPDAVSVDLALKRLLTMLAVEHDGRVVLVSGRSIAQLDHFLGETARVLTLVGSHGGETRPVGAASISPVRAAVFDIIAKEFSKAFADRPDVIIEDKSLSVAVHYRLDPEAGPAVAAMAARLAESHRLVVQPGKLVVELRSAGHDKGRAISAVAATPGFAGYPPVFIGDDATDEPGFAACAALGGAGILVGGARPSAARYRLDDVAAVRRWLGGSGQ